MKKKKGKVIRVSKQAWEKIKSLKSKDETIIDTVDRALHIK